MKKEKLSNKNFVSDEEFEDFKTKIWNCMTTVSMQSNGNLRLYETKTKMELRKMQEELDRLKFELRWFTTGICVCGVLIVSLVTYVLLR